MRVYIWIKCLICFVQYEEARMELSDLKEKYEKVEQEKQLVTDELEACRANMEELQGKGTKVSTDLSNAQQKQEGILP